MKTPSGPGRPGILFLLGDPARARNDNHERLPRAFRQIGWEVLTQPHHALQLTAGRPTVAGLDLEGLQLIWPLGFGAQGTFLDRMQLLDLVDPEKLVNAPRALTFLHGKYRWLQHMPETHAGSNVDMLADVITAGGGDWVVKPAAGSYGEGVCLVRAGDDPRPPLRRVIHPEPHGGAARAPGRYCLVQRFLPEVAHGETRAVLAGGELIGQYLRIPTDGLHANLHRRGSAARTNLTPKQTSLVRALTRDLARLQVGFAAVDLVGDRLLEVNVANPGGLGTLQALHGDHGEDFGVRAARAIARRVTA